MRRGLSATVLRGSPRVAGFTLVSRGPVACSGATSGSADPGEGCDRRASPASADGGVCAGLVGGSEGRSGSAGGAGSCVGDGGSDLGGQGGDRGRVRLERGRLGSPVPLRQGCDLVPGLDLVDRVVVGRAVGLRAPDDPDIGRGRLDGLSFPRELEILDQALPQVGPPARGDQNEVSGLRLCRSPAGRGDTSVHMSSIGSR